MGLQVPSWLRWERLLEEIHIRESYVALYQHTILRDPDNIDSEANLWAEEISRPIALESWSPYKAICFERDIHEMTRIVDDTPMNVTNMLRYEHFLSVEQILLYRALGRIALFAVDGGETAEYINRCALNLLPKDLEYFTDTDHKVDVGPPTIGFNVNSGLPKELHSAYINDIQAAMDERRVSASVTEAVDSEYEDCISSQSESRFGSPTQSEIDYLDPSTDSEAIVNGISTIFLGEDSFSREACSDFTRNFRERNRQAHDYLRSHFNRLIYLPF